MAVRTKRRVRFALRGEHRHAMRRIATRAVQIESEFYRLDANDPASHLSIPSAQDLPMHSTMLQGKRFRGTDAQNRMSDYQRAEFLERYAATGTMSRSASAIGVTLRCVRANMERDPSFAADVDDAYTEHKESVLSAAWQRAVEGHVEPVIGGKEGRIVAYKRVYNAKLLDKMLSAFYPDQFGTQRVNNVNTQINVNTGVLRLPQASTENTTTLTIEDCEVVEV